MKMVQRMFPAAVSAASEQIVSQCKPEQQLLHHSIHAGTICQRNFEGQHNDIPRGCFLQPQCLMLITIRITVQQNQTM